MLQKNISQKDLCDAAGITPNGFRQAKIRGSVNLQTLEKIAEALGVLVMNLFLDSKQTFVGFSGQVNNQVNENSPKSKNVLVITPLVVEPDQNVVNENPYPEAPQQEEKGKYENTYQLLAQCQKQNEALTIAIKNMEKTIQLLEERNKQG